MAPTTITVIIETPNKHGMRERRTFCNLLCFLLFPIRTTNAWHCECILAPIFFFAIMVPDRKKMGKDHCIWGAMKCIWEP
jgi:hypothetical protein